jgi:hypothetical protein
MTKLERMTKPELHHRVIRHSRFARRHPERKRGTSRKLQEPHEPVCVIL